MCRHLKGSQKTESKKDRQYNRKKRKKKETRKTIIHVNLHRKLKLGQHYPPSPQTNDNGVKQFLFYYCYPSC